MDITLIGIIIFYLIINGAAFFVMFWDKHKSQIKKAERIPEGVMFFMATVFGSAGVLAGMLVFRHKTQKWYFMIGIPILTAQNTVLLYLVYAYFIGIRIS